MLLGVRRSLFGKGQNAAWTPLQLASLLAWWSSDYGLFEDAAGTSPATDDGDVVGRQNDRGPGGYNATQGTTANKPTLQNAAGDLVNGLPVVKGDGLNDYLITTLAPPVAGTIAVSFKYNAAVVRVFTGAYKQLPSQQRCYISVNAASQISGGIGTQSNAVICGGAALTNGAIYVGVLTWDGANVVVQRNGVQVYNAAQAGTTNNGLGVWLHSLDIDGGVGSPCSIPMVDVVWCNVALTGTDLTNLETYMMGRVGL